MRCDSTPYGAYAAVFASMLSYFLNICSIMNIMGEQHDVDAVLNLFYARFDLLSLRWGRFMVRLHFFLLVMSTYSKKLAVVYILILH